MKQTIVFIDAGYLSFISKFFGNGKPLKYKMEVFAKNLAKAKSLECKKIYFYTAPPYQSPKPTKEENKRKANYDKFISKLKEVEIKIREGRCQKIDSTYQQKGVDTLLTIDLSRIPKKEGISDVIVVTSDTDFVPIINDLSEDGINVILAYFTDKKRKSGLSLSNHLWKACKDKIKIKKELFY
ncbi:NYN domain-containing protein [Candidatus Pacearchaeota archaeon]|nr:NYN domain-containing protein [Candidatus Pacearchaeota archaeon]